MKIVIHGAPDELRARGDDIRSAVGRLVDRLQKSDQSVRKLDYKALQGSVDSAASHVERARKTMLKRFADVLDG